MATLMVPTILQGAAVACFFIPLVSITLSGLPPDQIAERLGPVELRADHRGRIRHVDLDHALGGPRGDASRASHRSDQQRQPRRHAGSRRPAGVGHDAQRRPGHVDRIINAQAYVLSADDIFYASAIIFLLLLPLVWLTRRPGARRGRRRRALGLAGDRISGPRIETTSHPLQPIRIGRASSRGSLSAATRRRAGAVVGVAHSLCPSRKDRASAAPPWLSVASRVARAVEH